MKSNMIVELFVLLLNVNAVVLLPVVKNVLFCADPYVIMKSLSVRGVVNVNV